MGAGVSVFFNYESKFKIIFFLEGGAGMVARVNVFFYKESKSKKKK